MSPERADFILRNTNEWIGPCIADLETPEERKFVLAFWAKMPGSTCYHDALCRIAKKIPAEHRYPRQGTSLPCRCAMCQPVDSVPQSCTAHDITWGGKGYQCLNCGRTAFHSWDIKHALQPVTKRLCKP